MDFGLTPAAIVCQQQGETLCVLKEYTAVNMGVQRFLANIIPQMRIDFPMWLDLSRDYLCFIDPSGFFRKDTDETTCASVMEAAGFSNIIPGPVQWEERRSAVESLLTRRTKRGPCVQVSVPNCKMLVQGFQGGYRYPDGVLEKEPTMKLRPIKDKFSHIHDAFQGVCAKIGSSVRRGPIVSVPSPEYAFLNQNNSAEPI